MMINLGVNYVILALCCVYESIGDYCSVSLTA